MKEDLKVYNDVLQLIGDTPLIKLNKVTKELEGNYFTDSSENIYL